jgi:hypothetical protein
MNRNETPLPLMLSCAVAHAAFAMASPDVWMAPNLTVIGLVLSVARSPSHWPAIGVLAALCTMIWAVRFAGVIAAGCLAAAWGVSWVARQWDAADERVQGALVLLASGALSGSALWMHGLWSFALAGVVVMHTALTYGAFLIVRRLPGVAQRFY